MSKKKLTASKKELEKYVTAGFSYQRIAQVYGVPVGSVVHVLKREGLYTPKRKTRRVIVNVGFTLEEVDLLLKLQAHYRTTNKGRTIREAMGKAAIVAGLVPNDYRPPR